MHVKHELRRALLRSISHSRYVPLTQRYLASFSLTSLPRSSSRNKLRNRCIVSGRVWNVVRKTRTSRFILRQDAYFSYLPGARRASW